MSVQYVMYESESRMWSNIYPQTFLFPREVRTTLAVTTGTELIELVGELRIKLAAGRHSFNALYDLGSEIWTQWRARRYHLNSVDCSFVDDGRRSGRGDKVLEGPLLWPVVVG